MRRWVVPVVVGLFLVAAGCSRQPGVAIDPSNCPEGHISTPKGGSRADTASCEDTIALEPQPTHSPADGLISSNVALQDARLATGDINMRYSWNTNERLPSGNQNYRWGTDGPIWDFVSEPVLAETRTERWVVPYLQVVCSGIPSTYGRLECKLVAELSSTAKHIWAGSIGGMVGGGISAGTFGRIADFEAGIQIGHDFQKAIETKVTAQNSTYLELNPTELEAATEWIVHTFFREVTRYVQEIQECHKYNLGTPHDYRIVCSRVKDHFYEHSKVSYRGVARYSDLGVLFDNTREKESRFLIYYSNAKSFPTQQRDQMRFEVSHVRRVSSETTGKITGEGKVGVVTGEFEARGSLKNEDQSGLGALIDLTVTYVPNPNSDAMFLVSAGQILSNQGTIDETLVGLYVRPLKEGE